MKRFVVFALACAAGLVMATAVQAMLPAPPAIPIRVANADLIVVGKVTTLADKTEAADLLKNDTRQIQIATVKVEDKLMGDAGKEIKVGFIAPPGAGPGGVRVIVRPAPIRLSLGQEAALFLTKHPSKKDLYMILAHHEVLNKSLPNFAAQKDDIKKYARIMGNPQPTLKSRDAEERFVTAAMLISRYRTPRGGNTRTEVVPAEESKVLLLALADADWAPKPTRGFFLTPQSIFSRLRLGAKDGWTPPANAKASNEEAIKWLKANAGKYKLERYIAPKLEPSSEPSSDK